jgi:Mannosyltransferase (PIG-V)
VPSTPLSTSEAVAEMDGSSGLDLLSRPPAAPLQRPARPAAAFGLTVWPAAVYLASRLLLLAVAGIVAEAGRHSIVPEFFLFDGQWYLRLAEHGYPGHALRTQSTLGFFPLYALVIRVVAWAGATSAARAALIVSFTGGLVAAMLVQRLGTAWWGEQAGRRATVVFCLFPGSIVFSMAYPECLTIPLALGCLLALHRQRWPAAGLLAGLATSVEPVALGLLLACLAASAREIRSRGWRDPAARRSLAAPLLAPLGIGAFALFLWAWTGTPFAAYLAQHYGWHQQNEPLAYLALPIVRHLLRRPSELMARLFNWNVWNGVSGAAFLTWSLRGLLRFRHELTAGTLALTVAMAAMTLWSVMTPPNARMVAVACPAVMVWGRHPPGRRLGTFIVVEAFVLGLTAALTFSGHMLP